MLQPEIITHEMIEKGEVPGIKIGAGDSYKISYKRKRK